MIWTSSVHSFPGMIRSRAREQRRIGFGHGPKLKRRQLYLPRPQRTERPRPPARMRRSDTQAAPRLLLARLTVHVLSACQRYVYAVHCAGADRRVVDHVARNTVLESKGSRLLAGKNEILSSERCDKWMMFSTASEAFKSQVGMTLPITAAVRTNSICSRSRRSTRDSMSLSNHASPLWVRPMRRWSRMS